MSSSEFLRPRTQTFHSRYDLVLKGGDVPISIDALLGPIRQRLNGLIESQIEAQPSKQPAGSFKGTSVRGVSSVKED